LLALASGACSDPLGHASSEGVTVWALSEVVVIENDRSAKIVHFVVDAATAALIDWIPCVAEDCPGIMPGESLIIPADDIVGFGESDQVIVYWWHVYKALTGELYRGETRAVIVKYS
jgi:hypothetical protein